MPNTVPVYAQNRQLYQHYPGTEIKLILNQITSVHLAPIKQNAQFSPLQRHFFKR